METGSRGNLKWIEGLRHFLFPLFIVSIPISKAVVSVSIGALFLVGFFVSSWSQVRNRLQRIGLLWLPVLFYLLHVIGMIWTDNVGFGFFDLGIKSGLVLIPLTILLHADYVKDNLERLLNWLYAGMTVALFYCVIMASMKYYRTGEVHSFFYTAFSRLTHPSYFALELNTCLIFLFAGLTSGKSSNRISQFSLVVLFSIGVILLNSKAGILSWFLTVVPLLIWRFVQTRQLKYLIAGAVFGAVFYFSTRVLVPASEDRMGKMQKVLSDTSAKPTEAESSTIRLEVWKSAREVFFRNLYLGTGTGDIKDEMIAEYQSQGFTAAAEKQLNVHNQFFQAGVTLGIPGLILILLMFLVPFIVSFRRKQIPMIIFLVMTGFNLLVESMLETQAGVVFFAFIYSLLLICFPAFKPEEE